MTPDKQRELYLFSVNYFIKLRKNRGHTSVYRCNDADTNGFYKIFLKKFPEVGEEYTKKFIKFGFKHYKEDMRKIRFAWIFSHKNIKQWNEFGKLKANTNIDEVKLENPTALFPNLLTKVRESEESFKRVKHNTSYGFYKCLTSTTLYNEKSELCNNCIHQQKCKVYAMEMYPGKFR